MQREMQMCSSVNKEVGQGRTDSTRRCQRGGEQDGKRVLCGLTFLRGVTEPHKEVSLLQGLGKGYSEASRLQTEVWCPIQVTSLGTLKSDNWSTLVIRGGIDSFTLARGRLRRWTMESVESSL